MFRLRISGGPSSTGSPPSPDSTLLEVYVNSAIASVNILSATSFEITSPMLRVDDFIEVRVFGNTAIPTNVFAGAFNASTSIDDIADIVTGLVFQIDGTESV